MTRIVRLLLFWGVLLLGAYIYAILAVGLGDLPSGALAPAQYRPWVVWSSLAVWSDLLGPMTVAAALLAFAGPAKDAKEGPGKGLPPGLNKAVVWVIVSAVLTAIPVAFLRPLAIDRRLEMRRAGPIARELITEINDAVGGEKPAEALPLIQRYLTLVPGDERVAQLRARLVHEQDAQPEAEETDAPADADEAAARRRDALSYVARATEALAREEWASAVYFADLAYRLDPARNDALAVRGDAQERLRSLAASGDEEARLYAAMERARSLLSDGAVFEAHSALRGLAIAFPDEADVLRLLAIAEEQVRERALPIEEAQAAYGRRVADGSERLYRKLLPLTDDQLVPRFLAFDETVVIDGVRYLFEVGYAEQVDGEWARWDFRAAKVIPVSPSDEGRAVVIFAHDFDAPDAPESPPPVVYLAESFDLYLLHERALSNPEALSLPELFRLAGSEGVGAVSGVLTIRLLEIALLPLSTAVLSVWAMTIGIRLRSRYVGAPPVVSRVFVGIVPVAVVSIVALYHDAWGALLRSITLAASSGVALIVAGLVSFGILFVGLLLVAGSAR